MEPLGKRIRHLRAELGLSQRELGRMTSLDQGRLSRIEKGQTDASVPVIDRLASALQRSGRDLVAGTDREGYYFAQGLTPEQAAKERAQQSLSHDFNVLLFEATYERIVALFEALYGGPYILANIDGVERLYLSLRTTLNGLREALGSAPPDVHLPDHLEPTSDDDVLSWDDWEHPKLRRSLLDVRAFVHTEQPSALARTTHAHGQTSTFASIDDAIEGIRAIQRDRNVEWLKQIEAASKNSPFGQTHSPLE